MPIKRAAFVEAMAEFCTALRFLTVVPVHWRQQEDGDRFARSVTWFPLVGAVIGLCGASVASLLVGVGAPMMVAAAVLLFFLAAVSNALHLDGLADSADGLFAVRSRQRSLEIMKDSRIGSMGAAALILLLIGKFAALSSLPPGDLATALFLIPFAGRCALVVAMATMPCAREGEGIGALFYGGRIGRCAVVTVVLLAAALGIGCRGAGVVVLAVLVAGFLVLRRRAMMVLGGATGDILGAQCEVAELMCALGLSLVC